MKFLRRGEILGLARSEICFGRAPIGPVRRSFDANTGYARQVRSRAGGSVFLQEFLDGAVDVGIFAFAKMVVANAAFRVNEILGGPILVIERLPDLVVAV